MTPCPHPEKVAHSAEWKAWKQRVAMEEAGRDVVDLYPYKCVCKKWHLGNHQSDRPWKARKLLDKKIDYALHHGHHRPKRSQRKRKR